MGLIMFASICGSFLESVVDKLIGLYFFKRHLFPFEICKARLHLLTRHIHLPEIRRIMEKIPYKLSGQAIYTRRCIMF